MMCARPPRGQGHSFLPETRGLPRRSEPVLEDLVRRGYTEPEIRKLSGRNLLCPEPDSYGSTICPVISPSITFT